MSKKTDKFSNISAGLGEALDRMESPPAVPVPRTAPAQLMAFRSEMAAYEDKIAALEERIKDLQSTAIRMDVITPNPWQPRRRFDPSELEKLANSIASVGLMQPIVIRRVQPLDTTNSAESVQPLDTQYQIVAGERRYRAHKILGLSEIKAIVVEASDEDMAVLALTENVDREDLSDFEVALALKRAEKDFPNRKRMAGALGMQRSDLYRYLDYFKLPKFALDDLEINPLLLSRRFASELQSVLAEHGDAATESFKNLWPRVKSGDLDQGKIAPTIESILARGIAPKTNRDIKKLFIGKEQAGSITRDASTFAIKIRAAALTREKEAELRAFVEKLFA